MRCGSWHSFVWVCVDGEVRPGPLQELDHGLHHRLRDVIPEPARGRRPGLLEHGERDRRRHLHGCV